MSMKFGLVVTAALFASGFAFAQTPADAPAPPPASADSATPPASGDDMAKDHPMGKKHHHMHHGAMASNNTDETADKLNACMSDATPTSQQESCLKQASKPE